MKYPNIYENILYFCSGPRIRTWTKQLLSWGYEPPRFTITLIRNVIGCEGLDLNQRPLAYETSELPDCSTPQCLAMMGGVEPPFPIGQLL